MQGKVEICGVNTASLEVLSQGEMDGLLRQVRSGDQLAQEKLIAGNLRLVLSVIQRFDKRGETPDDLFQVGCIGLIKAISNFDPDKCVRFSTYGVPMKCSLGKKKGITSPKWLKIKQYQGFPNSQHHIKKTVLTSAKEIN